MLKSQSLEKLNVSAADFAEAMLVVRARLIEAVFVIKHSHVALAFPPALRNSWPHYVQEQNTAATDMKQAVKQTTKHPYQPDAKALSRAQYVFESFLPKVKTDSERKLLLHWAQCLASPKHYGSFGQYCKNNQLVRRSIERQLTNIVIALTQSLLSQTKEIACPNWRVILPLLPNATRPNEQISYQTYWRAESV